MDPTASSLSRLEITDENDKVNLLMKFKRKFQVTSPVIKNELSVNPYKTHN